MEALVQGHILRHLEADPGVDHVDAQREVFRHRRDIGHQHADAAARGELDRIVQQIAQTLGQLGGIAFEGVGQVVVEFQNEMQALFLGTRRVLRAQAIEQPAQAEGFAARVELAGLQFGQGEDVVDHAHHVARGTGGGALVLRQLRVELDRLHQLQRADHAIHRGAQLVGDGGEELVLEAVAVGQFLVQGLQRVAGFLEDARAFFFHRIDTIGQGQGQQTDFQRRADLAGIHGEEHVGQVAEHHQGVDHPAGEKGAPGDDEVTRHTHAAQPGEHPGGEDQYGEQQRQVRGQTQGQGIAGGQGHQHHHRAAPHHHQQRAIHPGAVFGGVQKTTGELAAEQGRRTDHERRRRIGPPGAVRPEIFDTGAVHRDLIQAERGDIEDVIQVAGVAHTEKDEQVVDQHHQQHAVDDAEHVNPRGLLFQVGIGRPERQRRLDRALAFET